MDRYKFLSIFFLVIAGCASVNPYGLSEGEGAYLKNRSEYKGTSYLLYDFVSVETAQGKKSLEPDAITAVDDAVYNVPAGPVTLSGKVLYYPGGGPVSSVGEALGISFKYLFSSKARKRFNEVVNHFEIWYVNPEERVKGYEPLNFEAIEGEAYYVDCSIDEGRPKIWIKDSSEQAVSNAVWGIGFTKHNEPFYWTNLPEPIPKQD